MKSMLDLKTRARWGAVRVGAAALVAASGLAIAAVATAAAQDDPAPGETPAERVSPGTSQPIPTDAIRRAMGGGGEDDGEVKFPPFADVSKGFEKVVSTADGQQSFYTLWVRKRDNRMLAELPRGFENQRHFVALTVASGEDYAGLQAGDLYVYWRRINNRLVLLEPQIETRAMGTEGEVRSSVRNLFTDRVILDVPIVAMGPGGTPVIDMNDLLVNRAATFFGPRVRGQGNLAVVKKAKAFPQNVEIAFEMPMAGGRLQELHYSISLIPDSTGYQPRVADERIGYFTTVYRDLSKFNDDQKWVRFINRWHIEKRDPRLAMSPPKEPIVFYIDHTVPVRYRRWVRDGILRWNKAFEKVGIIDAIEVRQQDAETGQYMDMDPEDVRYNFIRWLANDQGTAIGPSRVHPLTGQILDADVILTDGWIRYWWFNWNQMLPQMAMEGMSPETLAWLESRPHWDPRVRLADPAEREAMIAQRARRGVTAFGGHALAMEKKDENPLMGTGEFDGLVGRPSQRNGLCLAARGKGFDVAVMRMQLELAAMLSDGSFDLEQALADDIARANDPVSGQWSASVVMPGPQPQEVGFTMDLTHDDGAVTGTITSPMGDAEVSSGTFDAGSGRLTLSVRIADQPAEARLEGTVRSERIEGTFSFGEVRGPFNARRTSAAPAPSPSPAPSPAPAGSEGGVASASSASDASAAAEQPASRPARRAEPAATTPGDKKDEKKDEKEPSLDGIPESFIGPLLADLTAHEVGHTLGLRHNFKASSIYTLAQINSPDLKGQKPFTGSVMDYNPININVGDGPVQGDWGMIDIGPYDKWAIEYGYTMEDPKKVLERVADPLLVYATDEDTGGPDPLARRYDLSKDPLDFARSQVNLARLQRSRLIDKFVKDGESWAKVRRGYNLTLGLQVRSISMMAPWVGGTFVNRDRKGDPNGRLPLEPVPVAQQRGALKFVVDNAFSDEAFGLTPDLLKRMTIDRWLDAGGFGEAMQEPTFPVHERVAGIQASALTMLMNPTTLRRVFDNEFRTPSSEDALTLPEVMDTVTNAVFSELSQSPSRKFTPREPMISSLRRNLQTEAIERLVDLTLPSSGLGAAQKPISNLAVSRLRSLQNQITKLVDDKNAVGNIDAYTLAHLQEAKLRIEQALDAQFIYNQDGGMGSLPFFMFGNQPPSSDAPREARP